MRHRLSLGHRPKGPEKHTCAVRTAWRHDENVQMLTANIVNIDKDCVALTHFDIKNLK